MKKSKFIDTEEQDISVVSEPQISYHTTANPNFYNPYKMIDTARSGVSKKKLLELSYSTNIDIVEMAKMLHVSVRTIQRYSDNDKLDTHISEHILMIEKLYQKGNSTFDSPNGFHNWMNTELFALNFQKPISFLDTLSGVELVYNKIGQFEHGIFA
ncbi:MAG: DUF2384 domain-containing protein [Cytophagales bacterium]|nr:MAG: DUF2384 domain-containing protein [Cytophagales bacterium]